MTRSAADAERRFEARSSAPQGYGSGGTGFAAFAALCTLLIDNADRGVEFCLGYFQLLFDVQRKLPDSSSGADVSAFCAVIQTAAVIKVERNRSDAVFCRNDDFLRTDFGAE